MDTIKNHPENRVTLTFDLDNKEINEDAITPVISMWRDNENLVAHFRADAIDSELSDEDALSDLFLRDIIEPLLESEFGSGILDVGLIIDDYHALREQHNQIFHRGKICTAKDWISCQNERLDYLMKMHSAHLRLQGTISSLTDKHGSHIPISLNQVSRLIETVTTGEKESRDVHLLYRKKKHLSLIVST